MTLDLQQVERLSRLARHFVACALANRDVQHDMRDLLLSPAVTVASIKRHPPVKVEFEHAYVIAGIGEAFAVAKGKPSFGELIGVFGVDPDTPVHPHRVLYIYKDSSPYNRRVNQRKHMKKELGKGWRKLVTMAMRQTLKRFQKNLEDTKHGMPGATSVIAKVFAMTPREFWRASKGKVWVELPPPPPMQLEFDFPNQEEM